MKYVENLLYLQTEFCLNDFASKNGYSLLELLQFLNLVLTKHETVAKQIWKSKIHLKDRVLLYSKVKR